MKGLVKYARGLEGVELRELPEPVPKEGELKVRVLAASICGSDVHAVHDQRETAIPVVLGHEYVGEVVEARGDTGDLRVGDWVSSIPACYNCGTCALCRAGLVTLCRSHRSIGVFADGAMADYLVAPAKYSFKISDKAKTLREKAVYALVEPLACVTHGVYERVDVRPGDLVVVSGPGVMGQLASQAFRARGARVIVSGLPQDKEKLDLARRLGAEAVVSSTEELREAVYARNPDGADLTCDATGVVPSLETCIKVIKPTGVHLELGMFAKRVPVDLDVFFYPEADYRVSNSSSLSSWRIALDLLETGKVTLEPFVSLRLPLSRWREGFDAVEKKTVYKAVLFPDELYSRAAE